MQHNTSARRLAFYAVDGLSEPKPGALMEIGMICVDRPRGRETIWEFNSTGRKTWASGTRLGYATLGDDGFTPVPEPALQAVLDARAAAAATGELVAA
jgi:hypothetical protein